MVAINENVFKFDSYKAFLLKALDAEKGLRTKMAKHLNCQTGFISQVINGDRHFSLEHIIEISAFFELDRAETDFLILLAQFDRAGSVNLQNYFKGTIDKIRLSRQRLPIKEKKDLSEVDLAAYHTHWYYHALHVLMEMDPHINAKDAAMILNIDLEKVEKGTEFLLDIGVLSEEDGLWKTKDINNSIGRDKPYIDLVHRNFRLQVLKSLDNRKIVDSHYSRYFFVSKKRIGEMQEEMADFMVKINQLIARPEEEDGRDLYALTVDCFKMGNS
jgi:uncharacterized protein (TIGR02147 family)